MELQRLKKYNKEYKYFSHQIDSLQSYLESQFKRNRHVRLLPEQVAQALSISELDIIFIFSLAAQEHLMKKLFIVYTKDHEHLGNFENANTIPNEIINKNTGEPVEKDDFYIDIVFEAEK